MKNFACKILGEGGGEHTDTAIGLRGSSDHVLDEITMPGGIDDGDIELGGLELPESNVDGDTTFTLSLQLVEDPGVLERALAKFSSFLLELLDGSLVDTTAFVDEMAGRGGLARVDVSRHTMLALKKFPPIEESFLSHTQ
jgi:hypothetical protein